MSTTAPTMANRTTPKASRLVRLEQTRADLLERVAGDESRTQVAQLGLIFDAGVKALGLDHTGEPET